MHDDAVRYGGDPRIGEPENADLLLAANFERWHVTRNVAADGVDLAVNNCRANASRIDIDDLDFRGINPGALTEGRELLGHRAAGADCDGLAFEIFGRLDRRISEQHDGARVAPEDAADGPDAHALRVTVSNNVAV